MRTLEDITDIVERLTVTVRKLTFRNLVVLLIISLFLLPTYVLFWVTQYENRPILNQILSNTKLLGVSDVCPIVQMNFNGTDLVVTYINYPTNENDMPHVIAKYRPLSEYDISQSRNDCADLKVDRDKVTVPNK